MEGRSQEELIHHIRMMGDSELEIKISEFDNALKLMKAEARKRKPSVSISVKKVKEAKPKEAKAAASKPKTAKSTATSTIKATKQAMEDILKQNGIEYPSRATKAQLEELIRKNGLIRKTELIEAHRKVLGTMG